MNSGIECVLNSLQLFIRGPLTYNFIANVMRSPAAGPRFRFRRCLGEPALATLRAAEQSSAPEHLETEGPYPRLLQRKLEILFLRA